MLWWHHRYTEAELSLRLLADASRARILSASKKTNTLTDTIDFVHGTSRLREQDLVAGHQGTANDSGGYGKHSMGHEQSAHTRETVIFSRQLSDEVDKLVHGHKACKLYLIAPPSFLGQLRATLSHSTAALVAGEIGKDLVNHSIDDIRAHLPTYL